MRGGGEIEGKTEGCGVGVEVDIGGGCRDAWLVSHPARWYLNVVKRSREKSIAKKIKWMTAMNAPQ